jgi:uncharacterized protein (DUF4415 family)
MKDNSTVIFDDISPEWTKGDFARALPASKRRRATAPNALVRAKGRPALDPVNHKQAVSIRLDKRIIAHFKADGDGWQTRLNEFLLSQIEKADA